MSNHDALMQRIATMEANGISRDREIRDLKAEVRSANEKLDAIQLALAQQDGAIGLGKWLVGTGFVGVIGSAIYGIFHFFAYYIEKS
jgi:hypothetical protein